MIKITPEKNGDRQRRRRNAQTTDEAQCYKCTFPDSIACLFQPKNKQQRI